MRKNLIKLLYDETERDNVHDDDTVLSYYPTITKNNTYSTI